MANNSFVFGIALLLVVLPGLLAQLPNEQSTGASKSSIVINFRPCLMPNVIDIMILFNGPKCSCNDGKVECRIQSFVCSCEFGYYWNGSACVHGSECTAEEVVTETTTEEVPQVTLPYEY